MQFKYIPASREQHKKRVAAYCRVSTLLTEQEESIEFQKSYYRTFIENHPDWEFAGIFSDEKSGLSVANRAGFQEMIDAALRGDVDYILCKSISRFSRNMVDCQKYIKILKSRGVYVYFEKERINTGEPSSSMMFSFLSTISQDESRSISDNVKWAYRERFKRGEYNLGNNRVLGYDSIDGKLVPNNDAEVVRFIFQLFLEDRTPGQVADALKSVGIVGKNGKPLTTSGIVYILNNEVYVGDKLLQKRAPKNFLTKQPEKGAEFKSLYFFDDHEAIIDRETWEQTQRRLQGNKNSRASRANSKGAGAGSKGASGANGSVQDSKEGAGAGDGGAGNTHPLYGLIICADCGSLLTRRTHYSSRKTKTTHKVWVCKERYRGRKGNGCQMRAVKETELLRAIEEQAEVKLGVKFGWAEVINDIAEVIVSQRGIKVVWKIELKIELARGAA